jgi:hypothetical protein
MRCVFDVQHTSGMQSTFHRSCSSITGITCELLSAEMFQMARAVDNKRQQTCAVLLLPSLYSLLPHCYPCTISLLYHPTFDSPSPFPVKSTSQSDRPACQLDWKPWRVFAVLVAILLLPNNSFCHFCVTCLASPDTFCLLNSIDQEIKIKSYSVVVLLGCLQKLSAVRFSRVWTCANLFRTLICF